MALALQTSSILLLFQLIIGLQALSTSLAPFFGLPTQGRIRSKDILTPTVALSFAQDLQDYCIAIALGLCGWIVLLEMVVISQPANEFATWKKLLAQFF